MCDLDPAFLSTGRGGGVIQGSASEAVLVAIIAARERVLGPIRQSRNGNEVATVASRLDRIHVATGGECSDPQHMTVQHCLKVILTLIYCWYIRRRILNLNK
jgi:aromatic-L-amino-acid/L-tryptophan decarboxylase